MCHGYWARTQCGGAGHPSVGTDDYGILNPDRLSFSPGFH
jgi:hypothetical protein